MATVFVGLSGGVDSAVSAALLKKSGHIVIGAFIKIWQPEFIECQWQKERLDAMRVCAFLEIPFREIDLSLEYKGEVIQDLIDGYRKGITPNPDVLCNRHIKFGAFKKWALSEGADYIATGHYAQIQTVNGVYELHRGAHEAKDQSYFLWQLTQDDLSHTLFPVGHLTKVEVREIARSLNLPVASKRDSQGLCFVGDVSMQEFLAQYIDVKPGAVVDNNGTTIGTHRGAALYTLGERHGFTISKQTAETPAQFVIDIDVEHNVITVDAEVALAARTMIELGSINWISEAARDGYAYTAQSRYHEPCVHVTTEQASPVRIRFTEPHLAPPGQSLVLYDGNRVMGGGIIAVSKTW